MTVSSSTSRVSYNGNGSTTVFAYTFKVLDQDDLTVIVRSSNGTETVQTITTHYTVSGVGSDSGGNVTMVTAPASGETITILREQPLTQGLDLVPNDPFPAETLEEALDKLTFMVQTIDEEVGRSLKASRTNTISTTEFTVSASDRANKVFAFDSSGDIAVTQEIGTFTGNWAASTSYQERDIIKDTSNNNIYICVTAHTSSGSQPISSNADSAKWELLVDAASAATSATNAAASETAAASSATSAASSATAAAASESAAASSASAASTSETNAASSAADAAASAAAAATFDPDSVDINGGSIDGTPIGASSASTGAFTSATVSGDLTVDTDTLYVDSTNNRVGIGTVSPTQTFHTYDATANIIGFFESGDAGAYLRFADNGTTNNMYLGANSNDMVFATNGSEAARIDSSGNFGIGTTSPEQALDVAGNIKLTGSIAKYRTTSSNVSAGASGSVSFTLGSLSSGSRGIWQFTIFGYGNGGVEQMGAVAHVYVMGNPDDFSGLTTISSTSLTVDSVTFSSGVLTFNFTNTNVNTMFDITAELVMLHNN